MLFFEDLPVSLTGLLVAIAGSSLVSTTIGSVLTFFLTRRKYNADTGKTETETMIALSKEWRSLMTEFRTLSDASLSAEEQHSKNRIEAREKIAGLEEKVEKCVAEHEDMARKELSWAECRANMMAFILFAEPDLKNITSKPTLLEAAQSIKAQIENT